VASLLEVGDRLSPLTGREISILTVPSWHEKVEIKNKFDEIVAFAEVVFRYAGKALFIWNVCTFGSFI